MEGQIVFNACQHASQKDIRWLLTLNDQERERFAQGQKALVAATNEVFHFYLVRFDPEWRVNRVFCRGKLMVAAGRCVAEESIRR